VLQAESPPASPSTERLPLWHYSGPEIVGIDGAVAFHWDNANAGEIVATSIKTGALLSSRPIHGSRVNGKPSLWTAVPNGFVTSWDTPTLVRQKKDRLEVSWQADDHARWSTTLVAGDRLVAWQHEPTPTIVAHAVTDGRELWRTPIAPGANGFDLFINGDQLLVVWQQYDPVAPTPQITVAQRARAIALSDGAIRWTQDFNDPTGGIIASGNTLVVARDADLHFIDGRSGRLIKEVATKQPPNIYPRFAVHDDHVYVALNDAVTAYDATTGERIWRHPVDLDGGPALAIAGDELVVSTQHESLIAIARATGRQTWEVGIGMIPQRLFVNDQAIVASNWGSATGFLLPAQFVVEDATLRGQIEVKCRPLTDAVVKVAGRPVVPAADGTFVAKLHMAGAVVAAATLNNGMDAERPPLWVRATVDLDGRGTYDVGTLTLDGCTP
jgi:outer membrane protein assembly factor BamB